MKMKIAIVNTLPIPSGEASVNRILSYTKGLVRLGNKVDILSSGKSTPPNGIIDGVSYHCFGHLGYLKALYSILKSIRINNYDVVILVSNSLLLIYPLAIMCKLLKINLLQEKSEFPFVLLKKGILNKLFAQLYVNTTYKLFDGMIIMTRPLMDYFRTKVRRSCQIFEMPMTVDTERFSMEKKESKFGEYIAYCGDMAGNKDGVMNLIKAFNIASHTIPNVKLLLIGGSSSKEDFDKIIEYANSINKDRVIFYGRADRNEIPQLLINAKILALARPSSLQSNGGFPTKLGEYLSTGNPVIVTNVGDIPNYLNEKNAFTIEPDDNNAFANAIISVCSDYDYAVKIGAKGKLLAITVFSAEVQAKRLNIFLSNLI